MPKIVEEKLNAYILISLETLQKDFLTKREQEVFKLLTTEILTVRQMGDRLHIGHPRVIKAINRIANKVYKYCNYNSVMSFKQILEVQGFNTREELWKKYKTKRDRGHLIFLERKRIKEILKSSRT